MTIYETMKVILQADPKARERHNKDSLIYSLICLDNPSLKVLDKKLVIEAFRAYSTKDRAWRKVTQDNPELRGKDYKNKIHLEEAKLEELGYRV